MDSIKIDDLVEATENISDAEVNELKNNIIMSKLGNIDSGMLRLLLNFDEEDLNDYIVRVSATGILIGMQLTKTKKED